jgi:hypothetical protein
MWDLKSENGGKKYSKRYDRLIIKRGFESGSPLARWSLWAGEPSFRFAAAWGCTRHAAIRPNKHQRTSSAISQIGQNRKFSVCGSEKSVWHSILSGKFYQESAGTKPENGNSPANVLGLLGLIAARLV